MQHFSLFCLNLLKKFVTLNPLAVTALMSSQICAPIPPKIGDSHDFFLTFFAYNKHHQKKIEQLPPNSTSSHKHPSSNLKRIVPLKQDVFTIR